MTIEENMIQLHKNIEQLKNLVEEHKNIVKSMKGSVGMFELWAKKRAIPKYEYITSFEKEEQKYYLMDLLDREVYQEAMIINNQQCTMYREFEKPLVRKLKK